MTEQSEGTYNFLLETYETELLKILGIWSSFPESAMDFRPHPKSRTVLEQMEHQVQSEGRWMKNMLGLDTGDPNPARRSKQDFIEKYHADAGRRLEMMREKSDPWWQGTTTFFDVPRSRAWVLTRRITHSTHHRGQLVVYLRLLNLLVPSVYGPTADTADTVIYTFAGPGEGSDRQ
ncbi:MAG: DinB family protein [Acidobacteriia bacterium]|nr:DinB family protein [Terriglobia bacterium]